MFGMFETSFIMTVAIAFFVVIAKLIGKKISAAKHHVLWLVISVAFLIPIRPVDLAQIVMEYIPEQSINTQIINTNDEAYPTLDGNNEAFHTTYTTGRLVNIAFYPMHTIIRGWNDVRCSPVGQPPVFTTVMTTTPPATITRTTSTTPNSTRPLQISTTTTSIYTPSPANPANAATTPIFLSQSTGLITSNTFTQSNLPLMFIRNILFSQIGLLIIWLSGTLTTIFIWTLRHKRFIKYINLISKDAEKEAEKTTNSNITGILNEVKTLLGIKRKIHLMYSPAFTSPALTGLFKPAIIVPEHILTTSDEVIRFILLHEAVHIKRGDLFTRALSLFVLSVHWFNPVVYWMIRKTVREAEIATDDKVMQIIGEDCCYKYGETLISVARKDKTTNFAS
jgi:beta-lactamase regulating signal transducer with metallopeptidase domain